MYKQALVAATIFGMLAVILGAFGAHALKEKLHLSPDLLNTYETAVKYQLYHTFALLAVGIMYAHMPTVWLQRASLMFIIGIILFCGSIYALVALKHGGSVGLKGLGILTPIGGVFLILGWLLSLIGILQHSQKS